MALEKEFERKLQRGSKSFGTGLPRSLSFGKASEGIGMGLVRSTSFGRKRVYLTVDDIMDVESFNSTHRKKQCTFSSEKYILEEKSTIEAFPQDILIRILCGVEHDDLKSLFRVSKSIREATLIVKRWYFAYSTPKKTLRVRNAVDMGDLGVLDEAEACLAPKLSRVPRSQLSRKKLADISVALFTSEGENWPRRELFMEMETEI